MPTIDTDKHVALVLLDDEDVMAVFIVPATTSIKDLNALTKAADDEGLTLEHCSKIVVCADVAAAKRALGEFEAAGDDDDEDEDDVDDDT
jgi:hypothetical protein